ncbi:MAG TPA: DinB family protein [Moheibacter sp.]|nr:DinB family protein [Moheibacter sp.]
MDILAAFQKEFENEYNITKKFLANYSNDLHDWQPHPKSMKMQALTLHLVELFHWPTFVFGSDYIDFSQRPPAKATDLTQADLSLLLEDLYAKSTAAIAQVSNEVLEEKWQMRHGENVLMEMTRYESFALNIRHIVHHRAQLGVYYRLNAISVPSTIGPSADEMR